MDGPVAGVGYDAGDVGGHLFGGEAMRGGGVFDVEAEGEKDALVERMEGRLGGGGKVGETGG